jgi:hypothetical protein
LAIDISQPVIGIGKDLTGGNHLRVGQPHHGGERQRHDADGGLDGQ